MRLKVKEISFTVKPKQTEGKLVAGYNDFTVKPKPRGVKIWKQPQTSVLKHNRRYGVKIKKLKNTTILKQWD